MSSDGGVFLEVLHDLPLFERGQKLLTISREIISKNMNKLSKVLIGSALALAMVVPFAASAATISTPLFSNGDTVIDAQGGSTVSGTFTLQVGANEVCEVMRTQADTQAFTDTSVGGQLGYQQGTYTNVPFSVKVSPNTGTYNSTVQCAGIYGGNRSVDGADNVVVTANLGTIRVVANTTSSSTTGGSIFGFTSFADFMAAIKAAIGPATPPAPTVNPQCTAIGVKMLGTVPGAYAPANVKLQGFLLSEGASIPALAAGASFGFYGPQTAAAVAWFNTTNGCN